MTKPLTCVIADDEPLLARALKAELTSLWPQLEIVATAANGPEAVALIQDHQPDVAFLDIRMPGMTGIEVAQALIEDASDEHPSPMIVFVTAFDEYATRAFEAAAFDYVMKPLTPDRLAKTIERLKKELALRHSKTLSPLSNSTPDVSALDAITAQLRQLMGSTASGAPAVLLEPLRFLRAGVGDSVKMIAVDDVLYLQASDKYLIVMTAQGESLLREPLKEIAPRLDPQLFSQIHRSTIVNLRFVERAHRDEAGKLWLTVKGLKEKLLVSRLYAHLFKAM